MMQYSLGDDEGISATHRAGPLAERHARMNAMTLTINLPSEAEHQLRAAAARHGFTLEDYLTHLILSSTAGEVAPPSEKSAEEWVAEFRAWAASHAPVTHFVDDSRESIYEGRGG